MAPFGLLQWRLCPFRSRKAAPPSICTLDRSRSSQSPLQPSCLSSFTNVFPSTRSLWSDRKCPAVPSLTSHFGPLPHPSDFPLLSQQASLTVTTTNVALHLPNHPLSPCCAVNFLSTSLLPVKLTNRILRLALALLSLNPCMSGPKLPTGVIGRK